MSLESPFRYRASGSTSRRLRRTPTAAAGGFKSRALRSDRIAAIFRLPVTISRGRKDRSRRDFLRLSRTSWNPDESRGGALHESVKHAIQYFGVFASLQSPLCLHDKAVHCVESSGERCRNMPPNLGRGFDEFAWASGKIKGARLDSANRRRMSAAKKC